MTLSHHLNELIGRSVVPNMHPGLLQSNQEAQNRLKKHQREAIPSTLEHIRDELTRVINEIRCDEFENKPTDFQIGYERAIADVREAITKYCEGEKHAK